MGRPVHFEIHGSDPERLVTFYSVVFGWSFTNYMPGEYWLIDTGSGDGINGGLVKRRGPPPAPDAAVDAFVCSVGVDSVDRALSSALAAGATLAFPKIAIPGVGWQAYVKDPDGNLLGLHQPDRTAK